MENNSSQPPAPATPAAKVTPPANDPPKTMQPASSNLEVAPMASRTAATQHPQRLSRPRVPVLALVGNSSGSCGVTMPRPPTPVGSLACRPVQQPNPVVLGQGSSSTNQAMQGSSSTGQAAGATAPAAATHGPPAQRHRKKLKLKRHPSPPPPKLPVYRPPPPPRPELAASSSAAGNALLPLPPGTGTGVSNMQTDPPSLDQVAKAEEQGPDLEGGGTSGRDDVKMMLDLNFPPPVSDEEN